LKHAIFIRCVHVSELANVHGDILELLIYQLPAVFSNL